MNLKVPCILSNLVHARETIVSKSIFHKIMYLKLTFYYPSASLSLNYTSKQADFEFLQLRRITNSHNPNNANKS